MPTRISHKRTFFLMVILSGLLTATGFFWFLAKKNAPSPLFSEQELDFDTRDTAKESAEWLIHPRLRGLDTWKRPEGPLRVALQAGHWKATEAPDELENLRVNTGTSYGSITEWNVNLLIAEKTKKILEASGVVVDILPTTIPPNYWSDVFVAIHADGNKNSSVSGYKIAAPYRDHSQKAAVLVDFLEKEYGDITKLPVDSRITRAMRGYYAFNWRRYEHSLHPLTVAAIIETGFLSHAGDRRVIVDNPDKSALGIAHGILKYLGIATDNVSANDPENLLPRDSRV